MSDPFRSELEAAHARIEKLEADHETRVAELERENARLRKRLVDAAPPSQTQTGKTFFAIGMMTLGLSLVAGMFFARVSRVPEPHPIFELPMELAPKTTEIDETPSPDDFDRDRVAAALRAVSLTPCSTTPESGHVVLVIAPSGVVTDAKVDKLEPESAPTRRCVESHFREARFPAFSGAPRRIGKAFSI